MLRRGREIRFYFVILAQFIVHSGWKASFVLRGPKHMKFQTTATRFLKHLWASQ
jgi:hypothetical protein